MIDSGPDRNLTVFDETFICQVLRRISSCSDGSTSRRGKRKTVQWAQTSVDAASDGGAGQGRPQPLAQLNGIQQQQQPLR